MHSHQKSSNPVATIGLDIGKNTFHLVGLDSRGAIAMRIKVSRNQLIRWLVNLPPCLIGLEAGSGSHHIARQIEPLGHDVRLMSAIPASRKLAKGSDDGTIPLPAAR
jgi:transposase